MPETISWETPIETEISWGAVPTEEGPKLYQHVKPVRVGNRINLSYVFRNSAGTIIPLTGLAAVKVYYKNEGGDSAWMLAAFDTDRTTGRVYVTDFYFPTSGFWTIQFFVFDGATIARKGDIAKVRVPDNLDSITAAEDLPY